MDGVLLLDKPQGDSSNGVLQKVRWLFGAAKAGHTGALDPLATGLLPICFGEATKFSQFLLDSDKRYRVRAQLGVRTDTSDADGEVVETRPVTVSVEDISKAAKSFIGDSQQIPTMFSALKYQGQPLYKYARKGIEVPREPRDITVFELIEHEINTDYVELEIHCSKGTYIRTIIDDLGQKLGCGAHVTMLRRLDVAHFRANQMVTIESLEKMIEDCSSKELAYEKLDELLLPMQTMLKGMNFFTADDASENSFLHGQAIPASGFELDHNVAVENTSGQLLGIGIVNSKGEIQPKRLVCFQH